MWDVVVYCIRTGNVTTVADIKWLVVKCLCACTYSDNGHTLQSFVCAASPFYFVYSLWNIAIFHKYRFYCTPSHNIKYSIQVFKCITHVCCCCFYLPASNAKCSRVSALIGCLEYVPKNISTLVFLIINNLMMYLLHKTLSLASVFWAWTKAQKTIILQKMNKKHYFKSQ